MENSPSEKLNQMSQDAQIQGSGAKFMEPGTKKKRGRKPNTDPNSKFQTGQATKIPDQVIVDNTETFKKILRPLWETISETAGMITGEKDAEMKPAELDQITQSSSACVNQYFPNSLGQHANLIHFVTVSSIYTGRVWLIYQAKKKLLEEQIRANQNGKNSANGVHNSDNVHVVNG